MQELHRFLFLKYFGDKSTIKFSSCHRKEVS